MSSRESNNTPAVLVEYAGQICTLTLNRPEVRNAYNGQMMQGLRDAVVSLRPDTRVVVLRGNGPAFQAGADLRWLESVRGESEEVNREVSRLGAEVFFGLNSLPCPLIVEVHRACLGGGTGFLAAADVAIAGSDAIFSIAEVRWGLQPSVIVPQLLDAMTVRAARRYVLTGESFDAAEAHRIGLVHEVVEPGEVRARVEQIVHTVLGSAPGAVARVKSHILDFSAAGAATESRRAQLAQSHADTRMGREAGIGLAAFVDGAVAEWAMAGPSGSQ